MKANFYWKQKGSNRLGIGITDYVKIFKGVRQEYICCLSC